MNGRVIGAGITSTSVAIAIVYLLLLYLGYGWQLIAAVVSVATFAVLGIIGWIGWTMATTPAPKPVELETLDEGTRKKSRRRSTRKKAK